jgi:hypothetical protein
MNRIVATVFLCAAVSIWGASIGCDKPGGPGWYRGDIHSHSTHSDGDSSVKEVIAAAESRGLDFFVITDHDGDMGGYPSQWYDPDYHSDRMILLYGVEWTTGLGHANVWAAAPFDSEPLWAAHQALDARAAIEAAHDQGVLFSVNHPAAYACCPWEYEDDEGFDTIEVWNSLYRLPNLNFLSSNVFWDEHLLAGRRVPGVGGSDTHNLRGIESLFLKHGDPTTWVYAEDATAEDLLAGIRAGHVSISHEPDAARVDFTADTDGNGTQDARMGDNVAVKDEQEVTFEVSVRKPESPADRFLTAVDVTDRFTKNGRSEVKTLEELVSALQEDVEYLAIVLRNGVFHGAWKLSGDPCAFTFSDRVSPDERAFYRVEILGKPKPGLINRLLRGPVQALSNPIYFGYPE